MKKVQKTSAASMATLFVCLVSSQAWSQTKPSISEIKGNWTAPCHPHFDMEEPDELVSYNVWSLSINGEGEYDFVIHAFDDEDTKCEQAESATFSFTGRWEVSELRRDGIREIEGQVDRYFLNIHWKSWVVGANIVGMCGYRSWSASKSKEVTDRYCKGMGQLDAGRASFQIYDLDRKNSVLTLGLLTKDEDASEAGKRPSVLDEVAFQKDQERK